ncbi:cytochrome-c oxidase, cbb3-type subunit III [Spongiibacter sp. KMU-158]|uniref:Cbb3-type cytochrome c oxidase subunit n=1 Tax=Spongiibacter pelagi TaxID=2760804 RepID=A0A927GVL9_9GAMM|nr:cytochrome-c oxidase, cbb3-type subunit III [Spongiibacter pelagi]MBD2858213.1 cytochrome-c oxidase, cbb3-type subunit III [Spongiibacter pelagi]
MTSFWSAWIIVLTVISLVLVCWVLFSNRKTTVQDKDNPTTGHIYDGIEEYDNPLPGWWFKMFVITIIFAIGYLIAYPGMGNFKGLLGWTSVGQWQAEVDKAEAHTAEIFAEYRNTSVEALADNPKAMRMARRMFANNCSVCHGAEGKGSYGFPNLTDQDWLYGGSPEAIKTTITFGRKGNMPAWESALGEAGLSDMTGYVSKLSQGKTVAAEAHPDADQKFAMLCAACHMPDGSGNQMLGAPRLNDNVWLYGGDSGRIKHTLAKGRNGNMPAQGDILGADKIHLLTAFVYKLSHTDSSAAE